MSWEKARDRWISGRIDANRETKEDVIAWLKNDPIWERADKITFSESAGSHIAKIYIQHIHNFLPKWDGDIFDISTTSGRFVKKWIVEQLVKAYEQLQTLDP